MIHNCPTSRLIPQSQEMYNAMITLEVPEGIEIPYNCGDELKTHVSVDPCLAAEIYELWNNGVVTGGCCCGHNIGAYDAYILVHENSIERTLELGYEQMECDIIPGRKNKFRPYTVQLELPL